MIISCPSCGASFNIKSEALGPTGRTVKCSKCAHRWHADPDGTPREIAPLPAPAAPEPVAAAPEPSAPAAPPAEAAVAADTVAEASAGNDVEAAPEQPTAAPVAGAAETPEAGSDTGAKPEEEAPVEAAPPQDEDGAPPAARKPKPAARKPRNRAAKVVSLFALVLLISGVASVAVFMKQKVMIWFPATQRLYAMMGMEPAVLGRGLQIVEPKPTKVVDGNDQILVVEGEIRNISDAAIDIPLMRGALLDKQGKELQIWTFTAAKSRIKPGEMAQYRTEFRNPPSAAESLDITFTKSSLPVASAKPASAPQDAAASKPQAH